MNKWSVMLKIQFTVNRHIDFAAKWEELHFEQLTDTSYAQFYLNIPPNEVWTVELCLVCVIAGSESFDLPRTHGHKNVLRYVLILQLFNTKHGFQRAYLKWMWKFLFKDISSYKFKGSLHQKMSFLCWDLFFMLHKMCWTSLHYGRARLLCNSIEMFVFPY